jgi:hypothetical protein
MSIEWFFAGPAASGSPDHAQDQRDDGNNQQNVNEATRAVNKKAEDPSNDQDNRNDVQ